MAERDCNPTIEPDLGNASVGIVNSILAITIFV